MFEAAATTDSAKRALVRAEGLEPPRCYPSHSECDASACFRHARNDKWCRQGESNTRHPSYEGGGLPLAYADIVESFAETRALEPERPTGRRGALCTRAPSWTFTSFDPDGSGFMPASRRTADDAARAACRQAATSIATLRSRFDQSACW